MTDLFAAASTYGMTAKRAAASLGSLVALSAVVLGGMALARASRRIGENGRRGASLALVLGPIGLIIGALVVATADGGLGTGNGIAGGVVAMVLGLLGMTLAALARVRSRRID